MAEGPLKLISCNPDCGFLIRSHDEGEIVRTAMSHAKAAHGRIFTEKEARALVEIAPAPRGR